MKTGIVVAASLLLAIGSAVAQGRKAPKPDATPPPEPPPAESPPESGKKSAALTFDQLDLDKDGGVTWDEFLKAHVAAAGRNAADPHAAVMPAKDLKSAADFPRGRQRWQRHPAPQGMGRLSEKVRRGCGREVGGWPGCGMRTVWPAECHFLRSGRDETPYANEAVCFPSAACRARREGKSCCRWRPCSAHRARCRRALVLGFGASLCRGASSGGTARRWSGGLTAAGRRSII